MKCINCGQCVEPEAPRTIDAELKDERVSVRLEVPWCSHCERAVILGRSVRKYHRAVSDAYRRKVGLLTTGEMHALRRNLDMTLPEFADYLSIGIATLKRWNRGEIQTQALDRLVRLKADPRFLKKALSELQERLAKAKFNVVVRRSPRPEWASPSCDMGSMLIARRAGNSEVWQEQANAKQGCAA